MPEMPDVVTLTTISTDWGNDIRDRTVQRYATVAARTIGHPTPGEGDLSYLEDANALDVYTGAAWVPFVATNEVDGSVEVGGSVALTGTLAAVASVVLAIPVGWGSWKCTAYASYAPTPTGGASAGYDALVSIDGTDQQAKNVTVPIGVILDGTVGGRRTGMATTGNRTVSLRMRETTGEVLVNDIYLYARAVRTS